MTTETPKRHRWTKEELAHLNRSASHAKNKTDVFRKIGEEMGMDWKTVRSTYFNHNRPKLKSGKVASSAPRTSIARTKPVAAPSQSTISLVDMSERDLVELSQAIKAETQRRAGLLSELQDIWGT